MVDGADTTWGTETLSWMVRRKAIGATDGRPVAMGNFVHFLVVALVSVRHLPDTSQLAAFAGNAVVNAAFAAAFGWLLFCGSGSAEDAQGATCGCGIGPPQWPVLKRPAGSSVERETVILTR